MELLDCFEPEFHLNQHSETKNEEREKTYQRILYITWHTLKMLNEPCLQTFALLEVWKQMVKLSEVQKCKSPLEKFHMFSTLLLYYREYLLKAGHFMNLNNYGWLGT